MEVEIRCHLGHPKSPITTKSTPGAYVKKTNNLTVLADNDLTYT